MDTTDAFEFGAKGAAIMSYNKVMLLGNLGQDPAFDVKPAVIRRRSVRVLVAAEPDRTRVGLVIRAEPGKARCRFHGGKSTGPKTEAGRNRIAEASANVGASIERRFKRATHMGAKRARKVWSCRWEHRYIAWVTTSRRQPHHGRPVQSVVAERHSALARHGERLIGLLRD